MGVESYTVRLQPEPGNNRLLTTQTLEQTLMANGFHRAGLRTAFGPAHLTSPPGGVTEYERRDADAVVEAILYWDSFPGEPTRSDRLAVTGIDLRFAVCQPQAAETLFRMTVERMARNHQLVIHEGYRTRHYSPDQIDSFLQDLTPIVAALRANWQRLFGPGYVERAMSSAEAWGYYLNRQSSDVEQTSS